jgi:hypothetical protein
MLDKRCAMLDRPQDAPSGTPKTCDDRRGRTKRSIGFEFWAARGLTGRLHAEQEGDILPLLAELRRYSRARW